MGWVKLQDINFLALQSAVFCVQCELISENNTPACLACGSQAVLSLSRVLGGSLRGQQIANVIADAELNRLVRARLRTVSESCAAAGNGVRASRASLAPSRHHIRARGTSRALPGPPACGPHSALQPAAIDPEPAIGRLAARSLPPAPLCHSDGRSVCSKSALRHRTPLMAETLPPCRCSPA